MPDVEALQAAIDGIRTDRQALARTAHGLGVSSGLLLVNGSDHGRVVDIAQLVYVQNRAGQVFFVMLDGSEVEGNTTYTLAGVLAQLAAYPGVLQVHDDYLVNIAHVWGIGHMGVGQDGKQLFLSGGLVLPLASVYAAPVRAFLRLPTLDHAMPWNDRYAALLRWGVRHFDDDIHNFTPERLVQEFHHPTTGQIDTRTLIANIVWQYRCWLDLPAKDPRRKRPVDGNIRTFWYYLKPIISRVLGQDADLDPLYDVMLDVFNKMVARDRLFHYRDFGFVDQKIVYRSLGETYPHILMIAEKIGHLAHLQEFQKQYGFTIMALGGEPSLMSAEYLYDELSAKIPEPKAVTLRLIFMTDYDPAGNFIATAFSTHLTTFGMKLHTRSDVMLPSRFTPDELPNATYHLPLKTKGDRTKAERWIAAGGGVDHQFLGIECEALIFTGRLPDVVAELFAEAVKPPPAVLPELQTLHDLGLPDHFSSELLEPDPASFWSSQDAPQTPPPIAIQTG